MFEVPLLNALFFGLVSAVSLPLGALVARFWVPPDRVVAALMAFGAGALLSALTIDLVAGALESGDAWPLVIGAIIGGLLFEALNQIVNRQGGFLRKSATTLSFLWRVKQRRLRKLVRSISQVPIFHELPAEEIAELVPSIESKTYGPGEVIIREGDAGNSVFIVEQGSINIAREDGTDLATLGEGDVFGEMALMTGEPRSATATAAEQCRLWFIEKEDFDEFIEKSPKLAHAVSRLVNERISRLKDISVIPEKDAQRWFSQAAKKVEVATGGPTPEEIREAAGEHAGAPVAIWLGILLDGIPESLVIGASVVHTTVSLSLLAGLFLSNFPEALSSSVSMRQANYSYARIFLMWTSLTLLTGLGAMLGNIFFAGASHSAFALVEGIAAGAMLTMIAETMLPEAYHKGGTVTGLSTLFGFLVAILFKTIET